MRNMLFVAVAVMGMALSGCNTESNVVATITTPNVQRATTNGAGQVATAMLLDSVDSANLELEEAELTGCLKNAQASINGTLTLTTLGPVLAGIFPAKYSAYIAQATVLASGTKINTGVIPAQALADIKEFFDGALYRTSHYDGTATRSLVQNPENLAETLGIVPQFYMHAKAKVKAVEKTEPKCNGSCSKK